MSTARLSVGFRWRLAALVLAVSGSQADAAAQDRPAVSVSALTVNGASVATVDGVRTIAPGQSSPETRQLKTRDALAPGTVIQIPERTVVTLVTANGTELTLHPGSRTRLGGVSARGETFTQYFGEVWFKVVRALDFFEVTHDRFLAAVKGTEFKVAVDGQAFQVGWIAGQISVSRDVRFTIDGSAQGDAITLTEHVSADTPRVRYRRDVDEYLRDFNTYKDVEAYFRRQLAEDERSGDQLRLAQGWTNLGTALVTIGKPRDAIGYHERALALHLALTPGGVHPAIAADYSKLGVAHAEANDLRTAIEYYERSLELLRRLHPDGVHTQVAIDYTNLGVAYGKVGEARKAIGYYEQSLALLPRLYPDPEGAEPGMIAAPAIAANLGNLAVEYARLKDRRKAIEYLERALALHRRLHPDDRHPDIAVDYLNLGVQYLYLGDVKAAIDAYDKSLAILLQLHPGGLHPAIAVVYRNLESAWRATGDNARADGYAKKHKDTAARLTP